MAVGGELTGITTSHRIGSIELGGCSHPAIAGIEAAHVVQLFRPLLLLLLFLFVVQSDQSLLCFLCCFWLSGGKECCSVRLTEAHETPRMHALDSPSSSTERREREREKESEEENERERERKWEGERWFSIIPSG